MKTMMIGLILALTATVHGQFTLGNPDVINCPSGLQCTDFSVQIPGVVQKCSGILGVQRPSNGLTNGVVLFFSESTGTVWWQYGSSTSIEPATVPPFFQSLLNAGYEIIQVKWNISPYRADKGVQQGQVRLMQRTALVIQWIHDNWLPSGARYCLTGSSGGASQICYAVAAYGLDGIVDVMVPTGGPPMTELARGCEQQAGWSYTTDKQHLIDLAYGYSSGACGPCCQHDPTFAPTWDTNSNNSPALNFVYPTTKVVVITGVAGPGKFDYDHAGAYVDVLQAAGQPVRWLHIQNMAHEIAGSADGLNALLNALIQ